MGKEVSEFLELLVSEINSPNAIEVFWTIWQAVADEFISHIKPTQIESNDPDIRGILYWLFLHYGWQRAGVDWEPLRGYESRLDDLAEKLPTGVQSLSTYVRYLHNVGARSLPRAFLTLAAKLEALPSNAELSGDTLLRFEVILAWHVHAASAAIKAVPDLRSAVLKILDMLVERGSSAAFRMRDDFVTPLN